MLNLVAREAPYLWRLMIDRRQQGRGYGQAALELLKVWLASEGHTSLTVSCVVDPASPIPFCLRLGFRETGTFNEDGEALLELDLRIAA